MCGIAGILEFGRDARADLGALRTMCRIMAHRGPDDDGFYTDGPAGIGMRRLSIVDLAPASPSFGGPVAKKLHSGDNRNETGCSSLLRGRRERHGIPVPVRG